MGTSPGRKTLPSEAIEPPRRREVAIRGLRRDLGIDRARLTALLAATLDGEKAPEGSLSVALVSDATMRRMNREYRGFDTTTDVLSFSYVDEPHSGGVLGEVFVSPRVAARQAREARCPLPLEVARLSVHGTLHVLGWDHDTPPKRRAMLARQERYVRRHFAGPRR